MTIKNIFGYILIIVGVYFAIQALFGIYAISVGPSAPTVGTFMFGTSIFVLIPAVIAWLAIRYGMKMIA